MAVQIIEDAGQWKERKDSIDKRKNTKAIYGFVALICFVLSFTTHDIWFIGFIGFALATKV